MPITANKLFRVNISNDRLTVTLSVNGDKPPAETSVGQIEEEIRALEIVIDEEGKKNIAEFAALLGDGKIPEAVIVARGTAPKHDKNGQIEKLFEGTEQESETPSINSQSHYERSKIITSKKDQELIRLVPPVTGTDGTDVYGKAIARKLGRDVQIKLGPNVRQEGDLIIAEVNGKVECTTEKVWVDSKLEIAGDVDFSVGNIDFVGDIEIRKNVLDLFKVNSHSSITVHGVIEAALIHADLDLNATGGIAGKEKGKFSAGRNLQAKYITNSQVSAENNIVVRTEVVNCDLVCKGLLTIENGPLVGGRTVAVGGLKVKQLGSEADVKTVVEVGIDDDLRKKCEQVAPEIVLKRRKAQKVRQTVEPLLQNRKYLNSEQKEKATELIYIASELDDEAESLIEELRQVYQKAKERSVAEIEVRDNIYAGVTIRFPQVEALITSPFAGPLKVVPRKVQGTLRILAIDSTSGNSHVLDSGATFDELWDTLKELLGEDYDSSPEPTSDATSG